MRVVSFFAGCGGLDLGFEQAGFDVVWANEFEPHCRATYLRNHPDTEFVLGDICKIDPASIPDCDGFIGGPPCQSWSVAGKQKGLEDERGQLFLKYIDMIEAITQNFLVREDDEIEYGKKSSKHDLPIDLTKNLLICNVKKDNWEQYLDGTAKIYYTGKKFPTTVALNKLYYFMPYLSGKGIRDLYYIKIARLGYRKEGQENENKNDLRLVFEIERVGQLFDDYKKVKLDIWRTFTDTTMEEIIKI